MNAETTPLLLKANLKQLKLPTMLGEWEKLAREAAAKDEAYESYLLRLTEAEVTTRAANALAARIRAAGFPVVKDFDTFDFAAIPSLPRRATARASQCRGLRTPAGPPAQHARVGLRCSRSGRAGRSNG